MTNQMSETIEKGRRPFGLYIIIILQLINAALLALGLLALGLVQQPLPIRVTEQLIFALLGWLLVIAWVLATMGILRQKRWGWTLTMILTGLALATNIWQYFQGEPQYFNMVLNIVIVFYLNQREVQWLFLDDSQIGDLP